MKRNQPIDKNVPEFCFSVVKTELQVVNSAARREADNIMQTISKANFGVRELRRHVNGADDCKRLF